MPALFGVSEYQEFESISKMNSRQLDDFYADTATNDDWCSDNDLSSLILLEHNNDISSLLKHSFNTNTPSEDIWNKFDLLDNCNDDSSNCSSSSCCTSYDSDNLNQKLSSSIESVSSSAREIRHHDCMWAGRCSSEEHGDIELISPSSSPIMDIKLPIHQIKPINSRSILVKRVNQHQQQQQKTLLLSSSSNYSKSCNGLRTYETKLAVNKHVRDRMNNSMKHVLLDSEGEDPRPDTPVSEFDVHSPFHQHFSSNSEDSEEDYSDNMDEDDSDSHSRQMKCDGFYNDHSYHIVKQTTIKTENLGVQTPSDSEEEIDVVSLGETICVPSPLLPLPHRPGSEPLLIATKPVIVRSSRCPTNLPTNPSPSDKQHLQLSMAMAAKRTTVAASSVVPPIRIRIEQAVKRRRGVVEQQQQQEEEEEEDSSSDNAESPAASTTSRRGVRRGKVHRRANYDSSSCSSPRKRGSGSDSEDSTGKRTMHNTMERQRRVDLRNAFEGLRNLIPKLCDQEKAPKVNILKEAGLYCRSLQNTDVVMSRKMVDLRKRQTQLRDRVSQLRRSLAAHR